MIKMLRRLLFGSNERASKIAKLDRVTREHYWESASIDRAIDNINKKYDDPLSALVANMRRTKGWKQ